MPYDGRFVTVFHRELARRGRPSFPEAGWFSALAAADREQPCDTPPEEVGEVLSPVQVTSHERRPATDKYLMLQLSRACDAWWDRYFEAKCVKGCASAR